MPTSAVTMFASAIFIESLFSLKRFNPICEKLWYTDQTTESWKSQEERVGQFSAIWKPCLLCPSPIIITSPVTLLYHWSVVCISRETKLAKTSGVPIFGLTSTGLFLKWVLALRQPYPYLFCTSSNQNRSPTSLDFQQSKSCSFTNGPASVSI